MQLIDFKIELLALDNWSRTAFQTALENGHTQIINYCKESKLFDPNIQLIFVEEKKAINCLPESIVSELKSKLNIKYKDLSQPIQSNNNVNQNELIPYSTNSTKITQESILQDITKRKTPLSKLIEYPGDYHELSKLLGDTEIDINGKDMYGWAAIHKYASWDKLDSLKLLISSLPDVQDIYLRGGPHGFTCLHSAIDMGAMKCYHYLITIMDESVCDKTGVSAQDFARAKGILPV